MSKHNVVFFYRWNDNKGEVGIPYLLEDAASMTVKQIKGLWPVVAASRQINISDKTLVKIEIKVEG